MATRLAILGHFLKVGAQLSAFECALAYLAPLAYLGCPAELPWLAWNAACQIAEFVPVVVLPAMLTGHMAYVDIGWPLGLVVLGANGCLYGPGFWLRRWLMSGCMLLHGGRMCLGALVLFYPYRWSEDLPRYVYAKHRFVTQDAMPERLWPLKMLHDILQQAFANIAVLACPVVLCCFDATQDVHPVEWAGYAIWLCAWVWESVADSQKVLFVQSLKGSETASTAVLGHPPNAGWKYCLWTTSENEPCCCRGSSPFDGLECPALSPCERHETPAQTDKKIVPTRPFVCVHRPPSELLWRVGGVARPHRCRTPQLGSARSALAGQGGPGRHDVGSLALPVRLPPALDGS